MSKPYMCGDEAPVYIPSGGCDCNYTLQRFDSEDYLAVYKLMLNGSAVGDAVSIPRDKYLLSCDLRIVQTAGEPYPSANVGDPYLDFTIAEQDDHIYTPLADITGGGYKFVEVLPETGDSRYIYFVDDGQGNYDRYIWDADQGWIDIGSASIDLTDYYTKTQVDGLVASKQNVIPVTTGEPQTLAHGGSFQTTETTVDGNGNITGLVKKTLTLPRDKRFQKTEHSWSKDNISIAANSTAQVSMTGSSGTGSGTCIGVRSITMANASSGGVHVSYCDRESWYVNWACDGAYVKIRNRGGSAAKVQVTITGEFFSIVEGT